MLAREVPRHPLRGQEKGRGHQCVPCAAASPDSEVASQTFRGRVPGWHNSLDPYVLSSDIVIHIDRHNDLRGAAIDDRWGNTFVHLWICKKLYWHTGILAYK